jgi:RNA recognition motif-containing protein
LAQNIYAGNLPDEFAEPSLRELFSRYGEVLSVALSNDRDDVQHQGYGFVEMSPEDAAHAIEALDGASIEGRTLRVGHADDRLRPRVVPPPRPHRAIWWS